MRKQCTLCNKNVCKKHYTVTYYDCISLLMEVD